MSRRDFSRRSALKALGCGPALLPLLGTSRAMAAGALPRRLILFHAASLGPRNLFWPDDALTKFPTVSDPLAPFASDLLFVAGLCGQASIDQKAAAHRSPPYVTTGVKALADGAGGPSVDQYIAQNLPSVQEVPFRTLNVGATNASPAALQNISWRGAGANGQVSNETSNTVLYDKLFAGRPAMGAAPDPTAEKLRAQRKSLLDYLGGSLTRYSKRLGTEDRQKIEAHLTAVRDMEKQFTAFPSAGGTCGLAGPPTPRPSGGFPASAIPAACKTQLDIVAAALACDATRVVTIQWVNDAGGAGGSVGKWNHEWIDPAFTRPAPRGVTATDDPNEILSWHGLQHGAVGSAVATEIRARLERWYVAQFAYLVGKLKSMPEGNGSVLDNSAVVLFGSQGVPHAHNLMHLPFVIAGKAGGYFKTGRLVNVSGRPDIRDPENTYKPGLAPFLPVNRLLASLCNAMGMNVSHFGDQQYGGPLDQLRV